MDVGAVKAPRFGGANHASGYDYRSRYSEVGISGPWHRRGRQGAHPPSVEAPLRPGVLREAAAVPGGHRGLRHFAPVFETHLCTASVP